MKNLVINFFLTILIATVATSINAPTSNNNFNTQSAPFLTEGGASRV